MTGRKLRPHGLFFLAFCAMGAPALVLGCANEAQAARPKAQLWQEAGVTRVVKDRKYDPRTSLAPMLETVQPAVIEISVEKTGPFSRGQGTGSGFIISDDGYAVTNAHVVDGRDKIEVILADKRRFAASVVGVDSKTDVALIKLKNASRLPTVVLGDSSGVRVGDWVVAVGTPMGLEQSVSRGIVSAKGRGSMGLYQDGYVDFLQTDAAINPGNSGGPLFNLDGEVVGMNTAMGRAAGGGLGFSVPVDQVKRVLPDLARDGKVARGWLGVSGRDVEPALGARPTPGAVLSEIHPRTPAAEAGLKTGDRVVAVAGKSVEDFDDLRGRIGEYRPKDKVDLRLLRDGKAKTLTVRLGERPSTEELAKIPSGAKQPESSRKPAPAPGGEGLYGRGKPRLGVEVSTDDDGLTVRRVQSESVADQLGLLPGDVLREVNGKRIKEPADIQSALERSKTKIRVKVQRGDAQHTAALERR